MYLVNWHRNSGYDRNEALIHQWNAIADREVVNILAAGNGGVDFAKGVYRLANGEVNWENGLSVGGPVLGGVVGQLGKVGGKLLSSISRSASGAKGASNAVSGLRLEKSLASEAQLGELGATMAGARSRALFRNASKIAQEYGGTATDWVKKTSTSYTARDGIRFETHWVENVKTGQRVEYKTKLTGGN